MTEKNSRNASENPPQNSPKSIGMGKAVKYFRTLTKLSQENFTLACGIGKNTLQRIEKGKGKEDPHPSTIKKIIDGCQKEDLDIDLDIFNAKVAEYEQTSAPKANLNYTDPHYTPDTIKIGNPLLFKREVSDLISTYTYNVLCQATCT